MLFEFFCRPDWCLMILPLFIPQLLEFEGICLLLLVACQFEAFYVALARESACFKTSCDCCVASGGHCANRLFAFASIVASSRINAQ